MSTHGADDHTKEARTHAIELRSGAVRQYYFAYGSNMSSERLRRRVGEIVDHGWATLRDFRHVFDKRGEDATAKGNVIPLAGSIVHGVLYELDEAQLLRLDPYEGGYRRLEISVLVSTAGNRRRAITYTALEEMRAEHLTPSRDYLAHYLRGAVEHALPATYIEALFRDLVRQAPDV